MRVLFLLLLLANVLFLAWTQWVEPEAPSARPVGASSAGALQPIRLQREKPLVAADSAEDAAVPATGENAAAASCVSLGPFATQTQAASAAVELQRVGYMSRTRAATDEVRVGYWVRVPNLATAVDARNAQAALRRAGMRDAYVLTGDEGEGEPGNTVSVGVYADSRKAGQVAAAVSWAGFTPATSDRLRTLDVFWLDVDRQANGGLPALDALGPPTEGALPLESRACPAPAAAGDVR